MTKKLNGLQEVQEFLKDLDLKRRIDGWTKSTYSQMLGVKRQSYDSYLQHPDNLPIPAWMAGYLKLYPKESHKLLKIIEARHNGHK